MLSSDLDIFVGGLFGQLATLQIGTAEPIPLKVVFDEEFIPVLEPGISTEGRRLTALAKTEVIQGVSHGDVLKVGSDTYEVIGIEPFSVDGMLTDLVLKNV